MRRPSKANASFDRIRADVSRIDVVIEEMATASDEQRRGAMDIATAVAQLDELTDHTAGNAEQSVTSARELQRHAAEMAALVPSFRLSNDATAGTRQPDGRERTARRSA